MISWMKNNPVTVRLRARLTGFADDTRGTVTVEALIMLPLLLWAYCALFTFFDAYRQTSINHKAAYTLSDMLSRETSPVTNDYLDAAQSMLGFLTRSGTERRLRVTVVRYDMDDDEHYVEWSEVRGTVSALDDATVGTWETRLPVMVDEERLVLVETWTDYDAPFNIGLNDRTISTFVFTRPRFAPQLLFDASA
jgi:Flp pilus assembly protein TadG